MIDRRRVRPGRGAAAHLAAGACCAVAALWTFGMSPLAAPVAHADLDDLIDTVVNAAATGIDQADTAFALVSPEDLTAGIADFGLPEGAFDQLDELVANIGTQLDGLGNGLGDGLDGAWGGTDPAELLGSLTGPSFDADSADGIDPGVIDAAAPASATGGGAFLFGDDDSTGEADDQSGSADATDSTPDSQPPAPGHSGAADSTGSNSAGSNSDDASNSSQSLPKLSAPSIPKGGGGNGGGGGGNGGGSGNSNTKSNASASTAGSAAPKLDLKP